MKKNYKRLSGWSIRGRPFSPIEYEKTWLKKQTKASYSDYLKEFSRQWKIPKLRRHLK